MDYISKYICTFAFFCARKSTLLYVVSITWWGSRADGQKAMEMESARCAELRCCLSICISVCVCVCVCVCRFVLAHCRHCRHVNFNFRFPLHTTVIVIVIVIVLVLVVVVVQSCPVPHVPCLECPFPVSFIPCPLSLSLSSQIQLQLHLSQAAQHVSTFDLIIMRNDFAVNLSANWEAQGEFHFYFVFSSEFFTLQTMKLNRIIWISSIENEVEVEVEDWWNKEIDRL